MPLENFRTQEEFGLSKNDKPDFINIHNRVVPIFPISEHVMNKANARAWMLSNPSVDDLSLMYENRVLCGVYPSDASVVYTQFAAAWFDIGDEPDQISCSQLRTFFMIVGSKIPTDFVPKKRKFQASVAEVKEEKTEQDWCVAFSSDKVETFSRGSLSMYEDVAAVSAYTGAVIGKRIRDLKGIITLYPKNKRFVFPCDGVGIGYIACSLLGRDCISGDNSIPMHHLGRSNGTKVELETWQQTIAKVGPRDVVVISHCAQFCDGIVSESLTRTSNVIVYEHDTIYRDAHLLAEVYPGNRYLRSSSRALRPLKLVLSTDSNVSPAVAKWTSPFKKNLPFVVSDTTPLSMIRLWRLWGCVFQIYVQDDVHSSYIKGELMRLGIVPMDRKPVSYTYLSGKYIDPGDNYTFDIKYGLFVIGKTYKIGEKDIDGVYLCDGVVKCNKPVMRYDRVTGLPVMLPVPGLELVVNDKRHSWTFRIPEDRTNPLRIMREVGKPLPHPKEDLFDRPQFQYGISRNAVVAQVTDSSGETIGYSTLDVAQTPHMICVVLVKENTVRLNAGDDGLKFSIVTPLLRHSTPIKTLRGALVDAGVNGYVIGKKIKRLMSDGYSTTVTIYHVLYNTAKIRLLPFHSDNYTSVSTTGRHGKLIADNDLRIYLTYDYLSCYGPCPKQIRKGSITQYHPNNVNVL